MSNDEKFILPPLSREALDNLPFGVYIVNKQGIVEFFNKEMVNISGVKQAQEIEGQNVLKVPTYKKYGLDKYIKQGLKGEPFKIEGIKYVSYVGEKESIRSYWGIPIKNEQGKVVKLLCITEDITKQKRNEEQIKKDLKEKEVLVSEINHRVKNNMQIVYSLLNMQSLNIKDKKALELIEESKNQIKSMLLIHENLYQAGDLAEINFKDYINSLINNLFKVFWVDESRITKSIVVDNVTLSIKKAIPSALIINELVSNSLKYAFPDKRKGVIQIKLTGKDEKNIELIVKDNGVGLARLPDFKNLKTLGLELVNTLTKQLKGKLIINNKNGVETKIIFPQV